CVRATRPRTRVLYCPKSLVSHWESASRGYETEIDRANRELYRSRWAHRIHQDDIAYYAEDGLIRLDYDWLSVAGGGAPLLGYAKTAIEDNALERALAWRSRQCWDVMRENARLAAGV